MTLSLAAKIEAILFVEGKPIAFQQLAKLLSVSADQVKTTIQELAQHYDKPGHGLQVLITEHKVQLVTASAAHDLITALVNDERTGELSKPSLETLAIIAYRSPVTKAELEMIRGVNCSLILRNLLIRGLIEEMFDTTKGVEVYDITPQYLQLLGVHSVKQLPNYEQLNRDLKLGEVLGEIEHAPADFFQVLNSAQ